MIKFDLYLAGSMHGRLGREVLKERAEARLACELNGLTYYDPSQDEDVPPNRIIDLKPNLRRMKWFVSKDDYNIDRCKAVLVLTGDSASSGTLWECGRMYYKCKRPIYIVAPKMYHKLLTNFTTVKAKRIFETVEQAAKYLRRRK